MDRGKGLSTVRRAWLNRAAHRMAPLQGGDAAMSHHGGLPQSPKSEFRQPLRPAAAQFVAKLRTNGVPRWRITGLALSGIHILPSTFHATA